MPQTATPFTMTNPTVLLTFGGAGTPVEYKCQLRKAELTPTAATGGTAYETFCGSFPPAPKDATWALNLEGFQAFSDTEDLALLLFDHEGEEVDYELVPAGGTVSATNPGFTGTVTATPTAIGGTVGETAAFTVALQCTAKPTKKIVAAAAAAEL